MNKCRNFTRPKQARSLFYGRLLALLALLLAMATVRAQAQTTPVTLNLKDVRLSAALTEIEKHTSYVFAYDNSVDVSVAVSVTAVNTPLSKVLAELFAPLGISYEVKSNSIVLSAKKEGLQQPRRITGRVLALDGKPVVGASVVVKGTTTGTATDAEGNFAITVPADHNTLAVKYIGMDGKEVQIGAQTSVHVTLESQAVALESVVVTALGIKREAKALSYNVQSVGNEQLTTVKDANFVNSLSGKVAGVTVNTSSSGVGGASKVVMRGTKSIMQSSNALYVIDGVPMSNLSSETNAPDGFASKGSTEGIADLNPEDIESVSVLTGAAAAALYGSYASNGAIVITTKKGTVGAMRVNVTSNTEILDPFVMPQFQNRYGTGDTSSDVENTDRSWGRRLNAANYMGYDPASDYFQRGIVGTETVSVSRGSERNQVYLSAGAVNSRGIVPNNSYDRYNFTYRSTSQLIDDKLTMDVSANYILQKDMNMINQGSYMNPLVSAYLFPRGNDWAEAQMYERWNSSRKIYEQYWPSGTGGDLTMQNPYWINNRNLRSNDKDRYLLSAGLDYKILPWLSAKGRIRIDNTNNTYEDKRYATTNNQLTEGSSTGYYGQLLSREKQTYGDALLNINKNFCKDYSLHANLGGSFEDIRYRSSEVRGGLRDDDNGDGTHGIPNLFVIQQLSDRVVNAQSDYHTQMQSVFASVEMGYKGAYYLTVTGRNDWPSQLAGPESVKSSFFYPSVGGSVVLSQALRLPRAISMLKVRGSWAMVGTAFSRYLANPTYFWDESSKTWKSDTYLPVSNLKPERTRSWEAGIAMNLLRRWDLDLSFYNAITADQTLNASTSVGSQGKNIYIQSGEIRNRGVELSLGYKNSWRDLSWRTNYTFSANRNKILSIGLNTMEVGGLGQAHFILREGGTMGDLYSYVDLKRDSNGNILVDENGTIKVESIADGEWIKLGSVLPKANMSWSNSFGWKNLSASFMFSARLGGIVYSHTQSTMDYYGVSQASAVARDNGGVWADRGIFVDANKWYSVIGAQDGVPQYYTYSATNVRLQEASVGYTFQKEKLGDVCSLTLSLVGRNLWMIYNKAPFDPESIAVTGNNYQGIDYFMMPSLRSIGFNVRINF